MKNKTLSARAVQFLITWKISYSKLLVEKEMLQWIGLKVLDVIKKDAVCGM